MKLAISILNWNGLKDTIECISSILESTFSDYEIYLLDNGSENKKEYDMLIKRYGSNKNIEINKSNENLGFTGGNNYNIDRILKSKDLDYVMLLNNDCKIEKNFLKNFIKEIEKIQKFTYPAFIITSIHIGIVKGELLYYILIIIFYLVIYYLAYKTKKCPKPKNI